MPMDSISIDEIELAADLESAGSIRLINTNACDCLA